MRRGRFSEEQIIGILKEHQAGRGVAELCRNTASATRRSTSVRSKYGALDLSEAKRLRSLGLENAKLKRLLADAMLDVSTLKEMLGKTSTAQNPSRGTVD